MRLFIAEKPSVARAIAQVLGTHRKADGYLEVGTDTVTWCYGHLLTQWIPEEVQAGKAGQRESIPASALPIIPSPFRLRPRDADASRQIRVLDALLKKADNVVHAGDPDREGQLLVDEVLGYLGWQGQTKRIWLAAVDPESVKKALVALKDNTNMRPLSLSAEARAQADWLVGMNTSIAFSRNVQARGGSGSWSIGRVQTPTLALLVRREEELRNFQPRQYYRVAARIGEIRAWWQMPDDQDGLDDDGRLLDKGIAEAVAQAITGQLAVVISYSRKEGKRQAPMPFALSDLQKAASQRHGLSAAQTLEAAQKLYEAGISTYPRTDCSYLPEEQHGEAARILEKLHISGADPQRKHLAWNTTKVEAHHGILPTGQPLPPDATSAMRQVFSLIAESYARLFFPPELYEQREASFEIAGRRFVARSRVVTDPGWTRIGANNDAEEPDEAEDDGQIPALQRGEQKHCERGELIGKTTTPPKPYNDGTLIAAMTRIHTLVDDPKLKARLKETSGLGTEATRAGTIETLISREYAERRKKKIRPTQRGIQLVQSLRAAAPSTVDPGVTAIWEDALASVAAGRLPVESFLSKQIEAVRSLTQRILQADLGQLAPAPTGHICPSCNAPLLARSSRKGIAFLACSNEDCNTAWFRNQDGTPGAQIGEQSSKTPESLGPACPVCKAETGRFLTRTQKGYFRCPSGHGSWWDDNGKLGKEWEARKPVQASRNQRRSK